MNFIEQWMKKNKMSRPETADALDMSLSSVEKMAVGKNKIRRVVKFALLWIEHTGK